MDESFNEDLSVSIEKTLNSPNAALYAPSELDPSYKCKVK